MEVPGRRTDIDDDLAIVRTLCELCAVDSVNTQASCFCIECEQNMCNTCFKQHLRVKSCRDHTLSDSNASSEKCAVSNASAMKCKQHEAETVKFYCPTHDAVGCGDCLVSYHNGCKPEFIKDVSDNFQQNDDYETFMNKLEKLKCDRKELEKMIKENKKDNKVMLEKAFTDMNQFRLDINKYLDKLQTDISCQVKNVMEENDNLLAKLENDCTMLSTKLDELTDMLNGELYKDNVLFIHAVECKSELHESETAISEMKSNSLKKYEFVCDQQLRSLETSLKKFGTLAISTSSVFPQRNDRTNEINISQGYSTENDKRRHMRETTGRENVESRYKKETTETENDQIARETEDVNKDVTYKTKQTEEKNESTAAKEQHRPLMSWKTKEKYEIKEVEVYDRRRYRTVDIIDICRSPSPIEIDTALYSDSLLGAQCDDDPKKKIDRKYRPKHTFHMQKLKRVKKKSPQKPPCEI